MTGLQHDSRTARDEPLIGRHLIGVVMLDRDGIIVGGHGGPLDGIGSGRHFRDGLPFLGDHHGALDALLEGQAPTIRITDIHLRDAAGRDTATVVHGFCPPDSPAAVLVFVDAAHPGEPDQAVRRQAEVSMGIGLRTAGAIDPTDAAKEAKSVFLANISHELRTPLNVIIGNAEILRDWDPETSPAEDLRTFADDILENGTDLLDHINDLLDLAKAEAGGISLEEEEVDIGGLIDEALAAIGEQEDARALSLGHDRQTGLPRLFGDPRRLRQVMQSLLGNAVKFTPDGGSVSVRSYVDANGCMTIEVEDDGVGIAADQHDSALQPFGRVAAGAGNRARAGNGVGLPLARTLMRMHDGTLSLDSAPGDGTLVTLRFPANRGRLCP